MTAAYSVSCVLYACIRLIAHGAWDHQCATNGHRVSIEVTRSRPLDRRRSRESLHHQASESLFRCAGLRVRNQAAPIVRHSAPLQAPRAGDPGDLHDVFFASAPLRRTCADSLASRMTTGPSIQLRARPMAPRSGAARMLNVPIGSRIHAAPGYRKPRLVSGKVKTPGTFLSSGCSPS